MNHLTFMTRTKTVLCLKLGNFSTLFLIDKTPPNDVIFAANTMQQQQQNPGQQQMRPGMPMINAMAMGPGTVSMQSNSKS